MMAATLCSTRLSPGSEPPRSGERVGPFRAGDVLDGAFVIDGVIGVGGMGIVYEAHDVHLGRKVAIKAPKFGMYAGSLHREAHALAALRSPSFVTIHQLGRARGVDFIVMERLYGMTLEERIDELRIARRRFPIDELVGLAIAIAHALAEAHAAGFTLRDLKPANVVVTGGRVVLIDLGLAVPDMIDGEEDAAGTPQYMAPEVILRDVKPGETAQVDLYALGVLLFELATGQRPFHCDTLNELLSDVVCVPPPSVATLREDAPIELVRLVADLLAKKASERPPSAEAVVWRLQSMQHAPARRAA